jgi:hypothetical protein
MKRGIRIRGSPLLSSPLLSSPLLSSPLPQVNNVTDMRKIISGVIIECVLLVTHCSGQSITWQRLYNGPGNFRDYGWDVVASTNGNFFLLGDNIAYSSAYVVKINPYGDTIRTFLIDTIPYHGVGVSLNDGGCVIAADRSTTKIDVNGNIIWHKRYGPINFVRIYHIIKTLDHNYVSCGTLNSLVGYAFKTDSLGNLQWEMTYPAGFFKDLNSVAEAWDGGYLFVGDVSESQFDTTKALIMKTDSLGNIQWEKRYKVNNWGAAAGSIRKIDSGYILSGQAFQVGIFYSDRIFMLKTDIVGDSTFAKLFPSTKTEYFGDMTIINSNRYAIGLMRDSNAYILNGKAIITDSLGNILHERIFPTSGIGTDSYILIESVLPIPNGDIIFMGTADINSSENLDLWAARTDSNLNVPPIGIIKNGNTIPSVSRLYPNYPNPFNSSTQIRFDVSKAGNIVINVYDILGRNIATLVREHLQPGNYTVAWDARDFASGLYFCSLYHDSKLVSSQKILLIK